MPDEPQKPLFGEVPEGAVSESFATAHRRKEVALADLRELELRRRRGDLLALVEVEAKWTAIAGTIRERALGLPDKLAPQLSALDDERQIRELLRGEVRSWLTELSGDVRDAD